MKSNSLLFLNKNENKNQFHEVHNPFHEVHNSFHEVHNIHIKNLEEIEKNMFVLEKQVTDLDNKISFEKTDHEYIANARFAINKLKLFLELKILGLELHQEEHKKKLENIMKRLHIVDKNLEIIKDYNTSLHNKRQTKAIDSLTIVNTIFLPLTLIVGYFGMNFKSMGCPTVKTGILTMEYGQIFVIGLLVSITIIVYLLFKYEIVPL
jgi:magnesium transporter